MSRVAIEDALVAYLDSISTLTAIIGQNNIHPQPAPQNASYPNVTYYTQSSQIVQGLSGSHGIRHPRITLTCWGASGDVVDAYEELVDALVGYSGIVSGIKIAGIVFQDTRDDYDEKARVYRRDLDVEVWFYDPGSQTKQITGG